MVQRDQGPFFMRLGCKARIHIHNIHLSINLPFRDTCKRSRESKELQRLFCNWFQVLHPRLCTQGGTVQASEPELHLAEHWCHTVPLSWMALISALSWGRLILTVLTLSPVWHCDTGHRRNSQHPQFSKLKHHLSCHRLPIWSQSTAMGSSRACAWLSYISTHSNDAVLCKYFSQVWQNIHEYFFSNA